MEQNIRSYVVASVYGQLHNNYVLGIIIIAQNCTLYYIIMKVSIDHSPHGIDNITSPACLLTFLACITACATNNLHCEVFLLVVNCIMMHVNKVEFCLHN